MWTRHRSDPSFVPRKRNLDNTLYLEKRQLFDKELRDWQKRQPNKYDDAPGYHRAIFERVRFMMPERDRLASNLFQVAALRSDTGVAVLRDMMELYQSRSEVEYRPGLEPDKCYCWNDDPRPCIVNSNSSYNWRHIYICYKKECSNLHGFAELCFLCNEWVFDSEAWNDHCQGHLNNVETFPIYCDPLMHGGVLATSGYCPFCLTDSRLSASTRMNQFLNRNKWLEHIHKHVRGLDESKPLRCPHPHPYCSKLFESVKYLQFHLQDAHGIDYIKAPPKLKRLRDESEESQPVAVKRQQRTYERGKKDTECFSKIDYTFVNTTMGSMSDRGSGRSGTSSSHSTPLYGSDSSLANDETPLGYKTPLSSVCSEMLIDPAILPVEPIPDRDAIDVVDLTSVDDTPEPRYRIAATTQSAYWKPTL